MCAFILIPCTCEISQTVTSCQKCLQHVAGMLYSVTIAGNMSQTRTSHPDSGQPFQASLVHSLNWLVAKLASNGGGPNCRPKTALAQIFREQKQLAEDIQHPQSAMPTAGDAAPSQRTHTAATQALFAHLPFHRASSAPKDPAESPAVGLKESMSATKRRGVELQTADSFVRKFAGSCVSGNSSVVCCSMCSGVTFWVLLKRGVPVCITHPWLLCFRTAHILPVAFVAALCTSEKVGEGQIPRKDNLLSN